MENVNQVATREIPQLLVFGTVSLSVIMIISHMDWTAGGGGGISYKPIWDAPFFRVSFFSIDS